MVLVPGYHLLHCVQMIFQQFRDGVFRKKCRLLSGGCLHEVHQTFKKSHSRNLINDQEAFTVCHPVNLITVWIMGGTEGVGSDPFHTFKVSLHDTHMKSAAHNITILVFSETFQINRRTVDQNIFSLYLHSPDADLLTVFIQHFLFVLDAHRKGIEIGVSHLPQMCIFNVEDSLFSLGNCHFSAVLVIHRNLHRMLSCGYNAVRNIRVSAVYPVVHCQVKHILLWICNQLYRTLQPGIVEKVKIRTVHFLSIAEYFCLTAGDVGLAQLIVDLDNNLVYCIVSGHICNVSHKGKEPAHMRRHMDTV